MNGCEPPRKCRKSSRTSVLLLFAGGLWWPSACVLGGEDPSNSGYQKTDEPTELTFREFDFYTPRGTNASDLPFKLAPLLLQEVRILPTGELLDDRFGTVCVSNGVLSIDVSRPTVYVWQDTAVFSGEPHARLGYMWFYPTGRGGSWSVPHRALCQGVRLTLNSTGRPVIWEVLTDNSGSRFVFVSESLENTAKARFGPPLPGRSYSVEGDRGEAPRLVLSRVIADGPAPMGPMVYVSAGTRSVAALLCRCMPVQAKTLRRTRTYELMPLGTAIPLPWLVDLKKREKSISFWPDGSEHLAPLDRESRLPERF